MSKVGNDQLGTFILQELKKEGVDVSRVIRSQDENPTGLLLKSKVKEGDPQVTYYRKNSAASTLTSAEYPRDYFQCAGHLHVTGIPPALSAEMKDFTYHVMNDMRNAGKTISFDPNVRPRFGLIKQQWYTQSMIWLGLQTGFSRVSQRESY